MSSIHPITPAMKSALEWLTERGGDGVFSRRHGHTMLAAGEIAPFMRATFNKLREAGLVEFYGVRRIRVVAARSEVRA